MRTAFIKTLTELADKDERIWLLCGDIGYSVLEDFADRFPDRFVNAGVAEQNMSGIATGLSMCGKIVFIYSIANFPTLRCLEQIRNDICYHNANVKIVTVGSGFVYGPHGVTHHGLEDLAVMRMLPNMKVASPADPMETTMIVKKIMGLEGPCYLRLGKNGEGLMHHKELDLQIGKMITMKKGSDILIISAGAILRTVMETAKKLESEGRSVAVWSCPWLKPIDTQVIRKAAMEYRVILTVEEAQSGGGLGGIVAEILAGVAAPRSRLIRLGVPDIFLKEAYSQNAAKAKLGLDISGIYKAITEAMTAAYNL